MTLESKTEDQLSSKIQRWAPMIGGATLAVLGLSRRSKSGLAVAAAGGLVAYIASNSNANALMDQLVGSANIVIDAKAEYLYDFWLEFDRFPLFMRHLDSVIVKDNGRSHWVAIGPMGSRIEWDAEITEQREDEYIAWRSLPGSDIQVDGSVSFREMENGRGTLVTAELHCRPGSKAGGLQFARLLGKDPSFLVLGDLRRLKALVESGEIPTTEGQSHGPRSVTAGAARMLNPDEEITPGQPITEAFDEKRRAS